MKTEPGNTVAGVPRRPRSVQAFRRRSEVSSSVPHATLARRERAYKKKSAANPNRRGPKPKVKPSV